jgi:hypothetical protein
MSASLRSHGLLLLALAAGAGCRGEESYAQCHQDRDCAAGSACLAEICVARVGANPEVWSIEVTPGPQTRFAQREFPDFAFSQAPVDLVLDRKTSMSAALSQKQPDPSVDRGTTVHVVLSVPSAIAGRGELQFEGEGSSESARLPYVANVPIPARFLHTAARLSVFPVSPLDRVMPPWVLPLTLETAVVEELPTGDAVLMLDGKLEAADPQTPLDVPYRARARLEGHVVSNVAVTDAQGAFTLRMQRSQLGDGTGLVIELGPSDEIQPLPSLLVDSVNLALPRLEPLRLPASQKSEAYVVPVVGGADRRGVAGATVQFKVQVPGATGGTAVYQRAAQTGPTGTAMIPLIPGTGQATRDYVVQVTPPADSEFAARCVSPYSIGPATTTGQRVGAAIELEPKVVLEGHVLRADGKPAASVRVHPTRVGNGYAAECGGDLPSAPAEQNTDNDGYYSLRLDPGQYRLEVEPPQATPLPSTSLMVMVPSPRPVDVVLPLPVLVEGRVLSPDQVPVADAQVRAFGLDAMGVAERRGVALTDTEGRFRMILPRRMSP